jgi:hypothetical protein
MDGKKEERAGTQRREVRGIVIRGGFEPPGQPKVAAFIWGGKVRPVPELPYGRRTAA